MAWSQQRSSRTECREEMLNGTLAWGIQTEVVIAGLGSWMLPIEVPTVLCLLEF